MSEIGKFGKQEIDVMDEAGCRIIDILPLTNPVLSIVILRHSADFLEESYGLKVNHIEVLPNWDL